MWRSENFIILTVMTLVCADIFVIQHRPIHEVVSQIRDMPAKFGDSIPFEGLKSQIVVANPVNACTIIDEPPSINEMELPDVWFAIIQRYDCSFELKVRNAQAAGFDGVIVYNVNSSDLETMSAKNPVGINIPSVFVGDEDGELLKDYARDNNINNTTYYVVITSDIPFNISTHLLVPFAIIVGICFCATLIFMVIKCIKDRRRQRRYRLPRSSLNKIPICKFVKGAPYDTCAICLDDFIEGEKLRVLPCAHAYHCKCIDPWLTKNRRVCPICKRKVFAHDERPEPDSDSDSEVDDTVPLINPANSGTQGGTFVNQSENPFEQARRRFLERQHRITSERRTRRASADNVLSRTAARHNESDSDSFNSVLGDDQPSSTEDGVSTDGASGNNSVDRLENIFKMFQNQILRSVSQTYNPQVNEDDHTFATSSNHHSINADPTNINSIIGESVVSGDNTNESSAVPIAIVIDGDTMTNDGGHQNKPTDSDGQVHNV